MTTLFRGALSAGALALAIGSASPAAALELEPCRLGEGALRVQAQCGTLSVPEDPATPDGRRLDLPIAVLRATSREPQPDPLVLLAGGPGQAATEAFLPMVSALRRVRSDRDLILLDQRGTGESSLLTCPAFEDSAMLEGTQPDPEVMQALAARCAAEIAEKADLRFYTTRDAAGDLEALRQALGIDQINLYGVSYGTRLAQVYATLYPDHVRSIVLDGVVPLDLAFGPAIGVDAQAALDRILARCAAAAACNQRFPRLDESLARGLAALETQPRKVRAADPRTGLYDEVEVTREVAAQVLRLMTYSPETAALLPMMVDALGRGELDAIAGQWQIVGGELIQTMNQAMSLAVICAEDVPFFDAAVIEASTKSFLRDDVPKALATTCPMWPTRPLPEGARKAFVSDIPTLLLSGENDPVTPPTYGDRVISGLTKARHLIAPGQGHNVLPRGCASRLVDQFLDIIDPQALDAACLEHLSAPEPFLSPAGPAAPPTKDTTSEEKPS